MDGLRLIPKDGLALEALAQQVACWARTPGGRMDGRVRLQTGWTAHLLVPAAVCAQYGAPPFTSQGNAITCPEDGDGQVPWYVEPDDVPGLNITDCTPLDPTPVPPLAAPTGLAASGETASSIDLSWEAVAGADGYTVEYSSDGGTTWASVTATGASAQLTELAASTEYTVRVMATDSTGAAEDSPWSDAVTATTTAE